MQLLEHFIREDLNISSPRVMAVLRPLKVVIENYPEGTTEELEAVNNPEDPSAGVRKVPFSRTLYIEQDDFLEEPPKQFFRLAPGREVRLRYAYIITCVGLSKDPQTGRITELRCTYDPETKSGALQAQRKVKATIHWVSAGHAIGAEVRLYHPLLVADYRGCPIKMDDLLTPRSLERDRGCQVEPGLRVRPPARDSSSSVSEFCADPINSRMPVSPTCAQDPGQVGEQPMPTTCRILPTVPSRRAL